VLVGTLAMFTLVAAVLIWFIWTQLTDVLEGRFDAPYDVAALVLLAILLFLVRPLGRWLRRLEADQ